MYLQNYLKYHLGYVLITLGFTAAASTTDIASYSKESFWIGYNNISIFK